jgi:hypothetical protein
MLKCKHFWIRGKSFSNQREEMYSGMNMINLGTENTGQSLIIRNILRDVRLVMLGE